MKLAFTIGAYRLCDFVRLGILQIRRLYPDAEILISDDPSPESHFIKEFCTNYGCHCSAPDIRRGHFSGDLQALVNAVTFAEAQDADIAVKVSQRFIFRLPAAIDVIRKTFEDPKIQFAIPGQPKRVVGTKLTMGFGGFAVLSDIVMFRRGAIQPQEIIDLYRKRIAEEIVPWKDFIESLVHAIQMVKFPEATKLVPEFTDPAPDPIYLRRYQSREADYLQLHREHGLPHGRFPLNEWNSIEQRAYLCKPVTV